MLKAITKMTIAALACSSAANLCAQTQQEVQEAYRTFTIAQRTLGYNETCEVLDAASLNVAMGVVRSLKHPLQRVLKDQFKPDQILETARESFDGCKTREEAPQAWELIDYTRKVGAAHVLAPYLEGIDLTTCTQFKSDGFNLPTLNKVVNFTLRPFSKQQRDEINAMAKALQPQMKPACAARPSLGFDQKLRPAQSAYTAIRHYRMTRQGSEDPEVQTIKEPFDRKHWHAGYSTSFAPIATLGLLLPRGYRYFTTNSVAASIGLTVGEKSSLKGFLYIMRDRSIQARTTVNYDQIILREVTSGKAYPLDRTNPDVKLDFFEKTQAEFRMKPDVLRALYTAHDENAEFYIHYRSGRDGV